jgi:hypothetical protein
MAKKAVRLTNAQKLALAHVRVEGGLMLTINHTHDASVRQYSTHAGRPIHRTVAEELIRRGAVVANDDGIFPGEPQSWRALGT